MMMAARGIFLACLLFLAPFTARAVQPDEIMADPRLEARARALSAELRCMVCERLQAGDSDDQIRAFLVRRYGDFILLRPPFTLETWLLWGAPFLVLLAGGCIILIARRRQQSFALANFLSEAERAKLDSLLARMDLEAAAPAANLCWKGSDSVRAFRLRLSKHEIHLFEMEILHDRKT
jgi:cytochrome c-type biogenesis protein CcmH